VLLVKLKHFVFQYSDVYNSASPIQSPWIVIVPLNFRKVCASITSALTLSACYGFVAIATATTTFAQDPFKGWQWQNPLPQGNSINAIRFDKDKIRGWAVGGDGVVLRTNNGGFEWEEQDSTANTTLYCIYAKDRSNLVISGARGTILTSRNGGEKWVLRKTGIRDHLFSIAFAPDNPLHGWSVGSFGAILSTTDGGKTWKAQKSNT